MIDAWIDTTLNLLLSLRLQHVIERFLTITSSATPMEHFALVCSSSNNLPFAQNTIDTDRHLVIALSTGRIFPSDGCIDG